ncbi:MAG: polysaccharide deacetylase family protein [Pseudomonadota bacterium]
MRTAASGLILMYHRVAQVETDPWQLCVSPQHFAQQMQALRQHCTPMPLRELVESARAGSLPRRAVAITFDDGYSDVLDEAAPILVANAVPATTFLVGHMLEEPDRFWWDEVAGFFLQPGALPELLDFVTQEDRLTIPLESPAPIDADGWAASCNWVAYTQEPPTPRHAAFLRTWEWLQRMTPTRRLHALTAIRMAMGATVSRPAGAALTPEQARKLSNMSGMEIGAHGMTHTPLSALPPADQRYEIADSKRTIEQVIRRPVRSFAYPYGGASDYSDETVRLVQEAGIDCACSNFEATVDARTNPFRLPRLHVPDMDGAAFVAHVTGFPPASSAWQRAMAAGRRRLARLRQVRVRP